MARSPRRQPRTGSERARRPLGRFDAEAGVWLVPISDAWLDLLAREWSEPVQLRAISDDGGDTYRIKVREAANVNALDRLVALVTNPGSTLRDYRGDWNRTALRDALEAVLRARG